MKQPPALASWLLEHSGADNAVIGDINEEYAQGHTPAALGYFSSSELKTSFWRDITIDWLGGLTRPPTYEIRKKRV